MVAAMTSLIFHSVLRLAGTARNREEPHKCGAADNCRGSSNTMTEVQQPANDGVTAAMASSGQSGAPPVGAPEPAGQGASSPSGTTPGPDRHGFTFPTAYTILFLLLIVMAVLTWIIPAGQYELNPDGAPIPGTYHNVPQNPQKILSGTLLAPITGTYGIQAADGNVSPYNSGTLYGAINVALFVLVIGGFLGLTMKTGAIDAGIACAGTQPGHTRESAHSDPDGRVHARWNDLRHGRGEPGVLRADHRRDDRAAVRRGDRRGGHPARLRHRHAGVDHQSVCDGHRLSVRGSLARRWAGRAAGDAGTRRRYRDLVRDALRGACQSRSVKVAGLPHEG